MPEDTKSSFRGVSWCKLSRKWKAKIALGVKHKLGGKSKHLGIFDDDQEAARAYDAEARKHERKLNFPPAEAPQDAAASASCCCHLIQNFTCASCAASSLGFY